MSKKTETTCSPNQLSDISDKERIHKCSTVGSCYDFGSHAYSNAKCGVAESCGTWRKKGDVLLQGCIRSEYCGVAAEYEGHPTAYKCPQGPKELKRNPTPKTPTPAGNDTPQSAEGPDEREDPLGRTPLFSVMGYTDLDMVDGLAGLLGGMMKKDEKTHFGNCYGGIPQIAHQF